MPSPWLQTPRPASPSRRLAALGLALALALAGCSAAAPGGTATAETSRAGLSCREGVRLARKVVFKMGYGIEDVRAAEVGTPGLVLGQATTGFAPASPEAGDVYTLRVDVHCDNQGVRFVAETDASLGERLTFRRDFVATVDEVATQMRARPARQRAEQPPPEAGVHVRMHPLLGPEAESVFGADLPSKGLTPFRIEIHNRTPRRYAFATELVQFVTQDGTRQSPLPVERAASGRDAVLRAALIEHALTDREIAPDSVVVGYLYVPAGAYRRATVRLIDRSGEIEEMDGFSVHF